MINPTNPEVGLRRMNKRVNGVRLFLEHHSGFFYVLTNAPLNDKELNGGAYYLARCQVDDFRSANWQVCLVCLYLKFLIEFYIWYSIHVY